MPVFRLARLPDASGHFELSAEDLKHLTRVLRRQIGDRFEVRLPSGEKAEAILEQNRKKLRGRIERILSDAPPDLLPVCLAIGLIRWPRLEWLLEKATEFGVERVSPLHLKRSQNYENISIKYKRLEKIIQESLKQCERLQAPQLDAPQTLKQFLKAGESGFIAGRAVGKIFLQERAKAPLLNPHDLPQDRQAWIVAVGPEGGFVDDEITQLRDHDYQAYSLGSAVYRSETAALYALATLDGMRVRP